MGKILTLEKFLGGSMRGKLLKRYDVTFQERVGRKVKTQKQDERKNFFLMYMSAESLNHLQLG